MAAPPELYLSLLSGYGDVSHISTESRHNDIASRISGHPFGADPNRFMDLLDALAAICVHKEKGDIFFVSLAVDSNSTTLYVSSNKTVPATVTNYLFKVRGQLKQLHDALEFDPSITTSNKISSNDTRRRSEGELELQKTIYEHTYLKLRQRFFKRAPAILKEYPSVMDSLKHEGITVDEASALRLVQELLQWMEKWLQLEKPPTHQDLVHLIMGIAALCADNRLKGVGDENIVTRWDKLIHTKFNAAQTRILSLQRLLEKLCTLHNHIRTITRVAWSRQLSQFLKGQFEVVSVPADHHNISIKFSRQDVLPIAFPPGKQTKLDVQNKVYDALMERLKAPMKDDGLSFKKGTVPHLSMDVNVHAECTLLAYHLRHRNTNSYRYFGGSKLSCHGCSTFFTSYNCVAKSLSLPQFFSRGCHNKVYLRWACPSLLSAEERDKGSTLDTRVRKKMVDILGGELAQYVEELCEIATAPSTSQSDSTDVSGDSQPHRVPTLDEFINSLTQ